VTGFVDPRPQPADAADPVTGTPEAAAQQAAAEREDRAMVAGYIADMSAELAALAARARIDMLAYFLNLARVEAEIQTRDAGGRLTRRLGRRRNQNH